MALYVSPYLLATLVSSSLIYYLYWWRKRTALPLPPGPKGYPIIGNLFDMPTDASWEKYHEWCTEFNSDIIYLNMAGQDVIVLNSSEATTALLERRSSIYSDRPSLPMLTELMGFHFNFSFSGYGDRWRAQRKLMHQTFHPAAIKNFQPHMLKGVHSLLRRFLERPGDILGNLEHLAGETIMAIAYGLDVQPYNDPYCDTAKKANHLVTLAALPGTFLVDSFPFLKHIPEWMPGAGFKRKAREWSKISQMLFDLPPKAAKKRIDSDNYIPSFLSHCYSHIDENQDIGWQEYLIKGTAASMHSAASDTTLAIISFCIIALLDHPDILRRAQEEIDSVLAFGDLPTFDEESRLPLITAICMETMRWKDVTPMAVPHRLTEDDVYKGYRLPKGSIVIGNAWSMLHNKAVYPDPFSFKPDRFLKENKLDKTVRDPAHAAFGFGRRICPGRFMALSAIWIAVASLIAAFDISKPVDENGNIIDVDPEYDCRTLLRLPKPFACSIKPRSEKHRQAILATLGQSYDYVW